MSDKVMDTEILLEAGTNELEVLLFLVSDHPYAINVAKVREVMVGPVLRRPPCGHPSIEGVFQFRGVVVPLISLRLHLHAPPHAAEVLREPTATRVIVTEFNGQLIAFRVDGVEGICRISLSQVESIPALPAFGESPVVALIQLEDSLVPMLDFEMIASQIFGSPIPAPLLPESGPQVERGRRRVVVAEDSAIIQSYIRGALQAAGYQHVRIFGNGKLAWEYLQSLPDRGEVDLLISDVEMPQMDGLHLCRLVRGHALLADLPVVLFSSLISVDNHNKGEAVGATAQIGKPQLDNLVGMLDRILAGASLPGQR